MSPEILPSPPPSVAVALHHLGGFYLLQRRLSSARKCYEVTLLPPPPALCLPTSTTCRCLSPQILSVPLFPPVSLCHLEWSLPMLAGWVKTSTAPLMPPCRSP